MEPLPGFPSLPPFPPDVKEVAVLFLGDFILWPPVSPNFLSHLESYSVNATQPSRMNNEYQMKIRSKSNASTIKFLKLLPPYKS
jgi:hypothetical protein